jgi:hypothetical protein
MNLYISCKYWVIESDFLAKKNIYYLGGTTVCNVTDGVKLNGVMHYKLDVR